MAFLYFKALHIIFVVTWFAGLFYIVRLFIYFAEAHEMEEPKRSILLAQYNLMKWRLWFIITWPSALITLALGSTLVCFYGYVPSWLWVKLGFVALLYTYHVACHMVFKQQQNGLVRYSSSQLRIFNEVSTLFLFAIVFIVVLKSTISWVYGLLILLVLVVCLMAGIKTYKKYRQK